MKINLTQLTTVIAISMIVTYGCESRFVESSPDSVKIKGLPLEERLSQKTKMDSRIDEIQGGAEKIKRIIDMFKRVQSPETTKDIYIPIDFLLDANNELKDKIPENQGDRLARHGKVVLPIKELSEACRTIEIMLESSAIYDELTAGKTVIGERLTYSMKTCGTDGKYLSAIEADRIGSTLEFRLINKNLESIFNDILLTDGLKNSACKIHQDDKKIIESIYCENFEVKLSDSEYAQINKMVFNNSGDVRFETIADIYENDRMKDLSQITVFSNGEVKFDLRKIDEGVSIGK